jgi:hypothetical protein
MAVVKANYVKRGAGDRGRAKQTIRYITHRRDRDERTVTRPLFGYDGELTKKQVYQMIDATPQKGTIFYRIVLSPAPKSEDRYRDLDLQDLTIHTMLALEERLGKHIQFVAAIHDDHSPHRHVHTLVIMQNARLTKEDFAALRLAATEQALSQRRLRDRIRGHQLGKYRSPTFSRNPYHTRQAAFGRPYRGNRPYQSYSCPLCGYHQALPGSNLGYRCPSCGLTLRRDRSYGIDLTRRRQRGFGLELTLSP